MAERPIFIPASEKQGYVTRVDFDIPWAGGFAEVQKRKNISALHQAAAGAGYKPLLEISTKSDEVAGRHLSAFHLKVETSYGPLPMENAFQGSKVFQNGGPFTDLYDVEPKVAKRDPRLRESGALVGFIFEGREFPIFPKTVFYDWLYLSALFPHREWLRWRIDGEMSYAGFTDIEFNPSKSINCQAKTCALFVSLMRENRLETYMHSADAFISAMTIHAEKSQTIRDHTKQRRFA
ncbi:DarT1-associated NADAR antitoxin family protein [Fulvimarina pelagi]|uniref:DarT1-associated NADAR antitoxin family protein n=1 Tax=Fulvimarina pelagi TaxID=217511 RepID=UPI00071E7583|nr:hypothetical protein [Fulvimarina pelagi]